MSAIMSFANNNKMWY